MNLSANPSSVSDGHAAPAFVLMSSDRSVVAVSDAFAQLLGCTVAELCGRSFDSLTYWPAAARDTDLCDRLFAGEIDSYEIATCCDHKDGTQVKLQLQLSVVRDANGKVAFAVINVTPAEQAAATSRACIEADLDEVEKIRRAMFW